MKLRHHELFDLRREHYILDVAILALGGTLPQYHSQVVVKTAEAFSCIGICQVSELDLNSLYSSKHIVLNVTQEWVVVVFKLFIEAIFLLLRLGLLSLS